MEKPSDSKGRITGIGNSQVQIQIDNAKKRIIDYDDEEKGYLFSGALLEWAQLR